MRFPDPRSLIPDPSLERDRFALFVPVFLGTGIGWYFGLYDEPKLAWPLAAMGVLVVAAYALRRKFFTKMAVIAGLLVAIGFTVAALRTQAVATPVIYGQLFFRDVEGRIDDIKDREKGQKLILKEVTIERLSERRTPARISVTLRKDAPGLSIGDRVKLKATLFSPPTPAMPGSYDFTRALYYERIGAVGYAISAPEVLAHADKRPFEEALSALRLKLAERIGAPMNAENGPVAAALMVGEQSAVSKEVGDAMRDAGIYHVLSISGLHMSLAVALLYVTVRLLLSLYPPVALRLPTKKIAAVVGLIGAFAYLLLAGYPVPAIRSFVMVACVMVAVLFDRRGISLYSLAWAATLILLFQPEALFGASFQLSFAATIAIVAFYERYSEVLYQTQGSLVRKLRIYFLALIVTSLVASLATTPLVIYHFNRFTLWGIAANTLMMPLASLWIMPAAVLAFLAMPFGLEHWPLVWLDRGIGLMVEGSKWVAGFPHASFAVPSPTFFGIVLVIYGGLWLALWRRKWRLLGVPVMVLGMATIMLHTPYDLLASDDGSKVAVRMENDQWLFVRGRPSGFDAETWLRWHGQEKDEGLTLSDARDAAQCDKQKCALEMNSLHIVVGQRKGAQGLCADSPDIVISEDAVEDAACGNVLLLMDRRFLQQSGAVGVRFNDSGFDLDTAEEYRGNRPWIAWRPFRALPGEQTDYKE